MAGEVTNIELLLTRGRALGISFIVAEQVLSEISRAAKVSAHLVVAFCTGGTEIRAAAELLGLRDRREIERLQNLGKGQCLVTLTGDRCPAPLHIKIPELEIDRSNLTEKELIFFISRSLERQRKHFIPRYPNFFEEQQETKIRERDPNRLSRDAWRVFIRIAEHPDETIEERCSVLQMSRAEEEAARVEGASKGYVGDAGTFGRGVKFFCLLPKGLDFAGKHNVPVTKFKSGVVHEALLRRVKEKISKVCPSVNWRAPAGATGSIQPDAYGVFSDGWVLCIEVNYKSKTGYEVDKLKELCALEHVNRVLLVAPTKKAVSAIKTTISRNWGDNVPQKYVLVSATECLGGDDDFDWIAIIEKPT